jgi:serine/threonine-protein kinase
MSGSSEVTLVHPPRSQLLAYGQGRLPEAQVAEVEQHVAQCAACCESLKQTKDDTLVELARAAANTPSPGKIVAPSRTSAGLGATHPAKVQIQLASIPPELRDHPRYRIVERLGEGGMGVVYKAEHRMMERFVALKVISLDFTSHPTAVERFRQEVRAAAKLSHGNIVTAFDAEQAGELHFLVMEYVEGVSLAKLVEKKGPLSPAQVALFVRQVAQGLHHAHMQGMIHRDIKPQNLMVTRKGQVKILDFGLARFAGRTGGDLTKAEMIVGTPDYMAPEQARDSRNVDTRADIYSLGCTMYFLLTGQPPFEADSAIALMFKHCEAEPIPVEEFREDVPPELVAILQKMMAKKPADRYQTPAEAAAALMPFIRPLSQSLDLPQRPAAAEEVPVAELLEEARATVETASKTVSMGRKGFKRRARGKSFWKRHGGKCMALTALLLGLLGAWLAWPWLMKFVEEEAKPRLAPTQMARSTSPSPDPAGVIASGPKERDPARPESPPPARNSFRPRVLFVLPERLWYEDYGPVRHVLEENQFDVKTTSFAQECQPAPNSGGSSPLQPDFLLNDRVRAADYDAIVFVGQDSRPFTDLSTEAGRQTKRLLAEMQAQDKHITAICTGQYVLWQHGYLQGRRVAGSHFTSDMIKSDHEGSQKAYHAVAVRQAVVVDGKLITAFGPQAAAEFGRTLVRELQTHSQRQDKTGN